MKKPTLLIVLGCIVFSFLIFSLFTDRFHVGEQSTDQALPPEGVDAVVAFESLRLRSSELNPDARLDDDDKTTAGLRNRTTSVASAQRTERPVELDDWLHAPTSKEEVEWLNIHGFPSSDVLEDASLNYRTVQDFETLRPFSPTNVTKAKLHALTFPEMSGPAIEFLEQAAIDGSIYALESLATVHGAGSTEYADLISAAFLRAAELRGNWPLTLFRPEISWQEERIIGLHAAGILSGLNDARGLLGLPPLVFSPRPGLEAFLEALQFSDFDYENPSDSGEFMLPDAPP